MARTKHWSKIIEEHGIRVRLYQRPNGMIYRAVMLGKRGGRMRDRRSLGTSDRKTAELLGKALAKQIATAKLNGIMPEAPVTLGRVLDAYRAHKLPALSASWGSAAKSRIGLFEKAWTPGLDIQDLDQTRVDSFVAARRTGTLSPLEGRIGRGSRAPQPVRDGSIDADFRWLSSVFNWARRHKEGGARLLRENPLHDVQWPREKNPRRPVASHQRYVATMNHADEVDPRGRLRCMLALARYTGRRESAICGLRLTDLLLSEDRVCAALAAAGMDERIADHMPHGAIRWSAELDKQGILHVTPISPPVRVELDRYLQLDLRVGDAPLFPSDEDPTQPIGRSIASRHLVRAEKRAGMPKLKGGVWHPYRRGWASERKNLPDVDVAAAGGWKDTRALKTSYQQADPATVLRVIQFGA